jgi:Amidohydrolase
LQPRVPPAPPQPWADLPKVLELARRLNAVIKVSGACTLSREPYPFPDIWDPLARVFDAWGFDRCLWGTDWTRAFAVVNYEQAVEPFRKIGRLSDRRLRASRDPTTSAHLARSKGPQFCLQEASVIMGPCARAQLRTSITVALI